jgi:hypothetical protein
MKNFNDLTFEIRTIDKKLYMDYLKTYPQTWMTDYGIWSKMSFENGYGIQVSKGPQTIGGSMNLYEACVLDADGNVLESNPVMSGSVGNLDEATVTDYMLQIQNL